MGLSKPWNKLARVVVESTSLEVSKRPIVMVLRDMA